MCVLIFGATGWSSRSRPCLRAPRKAPNFNHERRPDCDETGRQVLSCGSPNECSARRESEGGTKHGQNYLLSSLTFRVIATRHPAKAENIKPGAAPRPVGRERPA